MTQLIIDTDGHNLQLPESQNGGYTAAKKTLSVDVEMISGRLVREVRGSVWVLSYQYGFFDEETKNKLIETCEKGKSQPITCGFLPPDSDGALTYSEFLVTSFNYPRFTHSTINNDVVTPQWVDFYFTLREVRPSD